MMIEANMEYNYDLNGTIILIKQSNSQQHCIDYNH